jgi:hypothetical protein
MFTVHLFGAPYVVHLSDPLVYVPAGFIMLAVVLWLYAAAPVMRHRTPDEPSEPVDADEDDTVEAEVVEDDFDPRRSQRLALPAGPTVQREATSVEELLTPEDFIGADENWSPEQELTTRFVETDPRTWDDDRYLDVLHAVLQTPTMIWTIVDEVTAEETDEWDDAWRALDDKLESERRRVGDVIASQDWGVDMRQLMRDIDSRDWELRELALEAALLATTDERQLVAVG